MDGISTLQIVVSQTYLFTITTCFFVRMRQTPYASCGSIIHVGVLALQFFSASYSLFTSLNAISISVWSGFSFPFCAFLARF